MKRYLIIGIQRSGTTVIHKAVSEHPSVSAFSDELRLAPLFFHGLSQFSFGNQKSAESERAWLRLFDAVCGVSAKTGVSHFGGKVCSTTNPVLARKLVSSLRDHFPGVKIILVERTDLVAHFGSLVRASKTGVYHSWNPGAKRSISSKTRLNAAAFRFFAMDCLQVNSILNDLTQTHELMRVRFEDFCDDSGGVINSVFSFLELPVYEPRIDSEKVLPPAADYIANYARLCDIERSVIQYRRARSSINALWRCGYALRSRLRANRGQ